MFCIVSSVVRTDPLVRLIEPARRSLYDGFTYHACPSNGLPPGEGDGGEGGVGGVGAGVGKGLGDGNGAGVGAGEGTGEGAGTSEPYCHLPLQLPSQLAWEESQ